MFGTSQHIAMSASVAGWAAIVIAKAYPKVRVDGFDFDEASIEMARRNAAQAGVADRVHFEVHDAAGVRSTHQYNLVTVFEAIHEMAQPIAALKRIRELVAKDGAVLIGDERVPDEFTAPGDDLLHFFYGASILFCLPTGMADQPSLGTGTIMRPSLMRRYALEAGFKHVEILPIGTTDG